jgi:hypothetical protein
LNLTASPYSKRGDPAGERVGREAQGGRKEEKLKILHMMEMSQTGFGPGSRIISG